MRFDWREAIAAATAVTTGTIIGASTLAFTMGGYEDIVRITPAS